MIVQCHGCKTRFRIADDKVSGRGVRVRCTRCGDTFVVRAAEAAAGEAAAARPAASPATTGGSTPPSRAGPPAPKGDGLDFDLDGPPAAPPAPPPGAPGLGLGPSGVGDLFGDLDLGAEAGGTAPLADKGAGSSPFSAPSEADVDAALAGLDTGFRGDVAAADLGLAPGEALRADAGAADAGGDQPDDGDPYAFGAGGVPDLDSSAPPGGGQADPFGEAADPFGGGAAEPDPFGVPPGEGAAAAGHGDPFGAGAASDPFGPGAGAAGPDGGWAADGPLELDGGPPPEAGAPAPDPFGAGEGAAADPFGAGAGEADPFSGGAAEAGAAGDDGGLELDLGEAPGSAPGFDAAFEPAGAAFDAGFEPAGAAAPAGVALDDDPFASLDAGLDLGGGDGGLGEPAFDLGGPPAASFPVPDAAPVPAPAPPTPAPAAGALGRHPAAGGEAAPAAGEPAPVPRRRSAAAGVAINGIFGLALVALLLGAFVAHRTGGRFTPSVFTARRVRAAFTGALAPGMVVTRFSNGLYPTKTGGQVLVVRGEATNNGDRPAAPGHLRVRLLGPGGKVVATATGVVGAVPTAPQVYRLEDDAAATALLEALGKHAPAQVKPHAQVPFFAVIPTWRGDLTKMRFQVSVEGAG